MKEPLPGESLEPSNVPEVLDPSLSTEAGGQMSISIMQCYLIAVIWLSGLACASADQPGGTESNVTCLTEFEAKKVKDGWKKITSPETPAEQKAVVLVKGNLVALAEKQKVTLKYKWVIVSQSLIAADTEKLVKINFNSSDNFECKFDISSTVPPCTLELDVAKKASQGAEGTTVKLTVQTVKGQTKLVLGVQQAIEVYSDEKNPRLLATGYLGRYGVAMMEK